MFKYKFMTLTVIIFIFMSLFSCERLREAVGGKAGKPKLTDEEQEVFSGCIDIRQIGYVFAHRNFPILVKGDPDTIRWYEEYETKKKEEGIEIDRTALYQDDICALVYVFSRALDEEAYPLMLQIIEQKTDFPQARLCAIKAVKLYGEFVEGEWFGDTRSIPVMKRSVNDKDPEIRQESAGVLLSLGYGDIAMPVLEKLLYEGPYQPLSSLFDMLFSPEEREINGEMRAVISETKFFDERGKDLLVRALNFPNDRVKMDAALRLESLGVMREQTEATALEVLKRLKDKERENHDDSSGQLSEMRDAGLVAINLLIKIKSRAAVELLDELVDNTDDENLKYMAKTALTAIELE